MINKCACEEKYYTILFIIIANVWLIFIIGVLKGSQTADL